MLACQAFQAIGLGRARRFGSVLTGLQHFIAEFSRSCRRSAPLRMGSQMDIAHQAWERNSPNGTEHCVVEDPARLITVIRRCRRKFSLMSARPLSASEAAHSLAVALVGSHCEARCAMSTMAPPVLIRIRERAPASGPHGNKLTQRNRDVILTNKRQNSQIALV